MSIPQLFTSESVTEGHPDKMADQISDAVLDAILAQDPEGHVACETMLSTGQVYISGEISTSCYVDIPKIAREAIRNIGYDRAKYGFDCDTCGILTAINEQSADIAQGVNEGTGLHKEQGAGDQGMMFGFAINETPELMPLPIMLAHQLTMRLAEVRKTKLIDYIRPDGKAQVTVEYRDGKPYRIDTVVVSTQHREDIDYEALKLDIIDQVIRPVVSDRLDENTKFHINPTGLFVTGGPQADAGLTGRKIIVDTYGGYSRHGGGAFSGKDPSKVDRSAAYAARYIAKNVVAAGLAEKCEIQLAYAIGVAEPVSVFVETFGTGKAGDETIIKAIRENFELTPRGIIDSLQLKRPIFRKTAAYGHFGRNLPEFTWEKTDKAEALRAYLGTTTSAGYQDIPQVSSTGSEV